MRLTSSPRASGPRAGVTAATGTWSGLRGAVAIWLASRVALMLVVVLGSAWSGVDGGLRAASPGTWLEQRFVWWDSLHFVRIAELGYLPPGLPCCDQAYFPGYPLLIRLVMPVVGGDAAVAALVVTAVAGVAAVILLWRWVSDELGPEAARTAVIVLSVAPYGLFLSAAYSESLFLALSVGAWWAAGRRRWWLAGLVAGGAALVRVNGLFLLAGLAVMYVVQLRADGRRRPRLDVLALLVPVAAVLAWVGYLAAITGSANAWQEAQARGWSRSTAWPWQGLLAGWRSIHTASTQDLVVSRWADLLFTVAGLALLAVLLARRRWPEATYVGISVGVLVCSTLIVSAPRYALTWFPAYPLLAETFQRRPALRRAVAAVSLPVLGLLALSFARHEWVA